MGRGAVSCPRVLTGFSQAQQRVGQRAAQLIRVQPPLLRQIDAELNVRGRLRLRLRMRLRLRVMRLRMRLRMG